jgi:ClpP class serine protease
VADLSRWFDEELKTTIHIVKAGQHKAIGVPGTEISEDDLAEVQRGVDSIYDIFVAAVARGNDMTAERAGMLADGRVHIGTDAVELGLADEVQSFNQTLENMIEENQESPARLRLAS